MRITRAEDKVKIKLACYDLKLLERGMVVEKDGIIIDVDFSSGEENRTNQMAYDGKW